LIASGSCQYGKEEIGVANVVKRMDVYQRNLILVSPNLMKMVDSRGCHHFLKSSNE